MKKIFCILTFSMLLAVAGRGSQPLTTPADSYAEAVATYVEAANREMVALHTKVELLAKSADEAGKARYAEIGRQLDECDKRLGRLTKANRTNFDKAKSAYEKARGEAQKALDELTKN